MDDAPEQVDAAQVQTLRYLKTLVTALAGTMIFGLLAIVALLVIRFQPAGPVLPEAITLPAGVTAEAVTLGRGWAAVVAGDEILIFDAATGALRQRVAIAP